MSGGGGKVAKGRMSSRIHDDVSPQQLTQMESSLTRKERELEVCMYHYASILNSGFGSVPAKPCRDESH